jgi:hypothetical protein
MSCEGGFDIGGYVQTLTGLPNCTDPTAKISDTLWRAIIRAKAVADISSGTVPNIYNYLVDGLGMTAPTIHDDWAGFFNVEIADADLLYQGDRWRTSEHGPRAGGVDLRFQNWTFEYLPFSQYLTTVGNWKIDEENISGDRIKTLECSASDLSWLPTSYFGITTSAAAYGTWETWILRTNVATMYYLPIAAAAEQRTHATQDGYALFVDTNNAIGLQRYDNGVATQLFKSANGIIVSGSYTKYKVVRTATGEFSVYASDTLVTASVGTNPVTDNTYTTSTYQVLDFENNHRITLVDLDDDTQKTTYVPI